MEAYYRRWGYYLRWTSAGNSSNGGYAAGLRENDGLSIIGVMLRIAPLLALCLLISGLDGRAQTTGRILTKCTDVRTLSRGEAASGLPVRLSGVVTFSNAVNGFVLDDGSGIWINLHLRTAVLPLPGERVRVEGRTGEGRFAPVVLARRLTQLGVAPLPPAQDLIGSAMRSAEMDCRRVRVKGVVRCQIAVQPGDGHVAALVIATPHGLIPFQLFGEEPYVGTEWEDAEVEVTSVCRMIFNARGQPQGVRLTGNTLDDLRVTRPAPADAFSAPLVPLDEVLRFSSAGPILHRRRVVGTVTLSQPGKFFYLQEGPHALRVNTRQSDQLASGDRVEVSGFLDITHNKARLEEGRFRRIGSGAVAMPAKIAVEQVLGTSTYPWRDANLDFDDRLIAVEGRLLTVEDRRHEGWRLNLERAGILVPVEFAPGTDIRALETLAPGTELRVRGVCALTFYESTSVLSWPRAISLRVLARGAEDIEIIQLATWWTARRLGTALAVSSTVLLSAALWIVLLRRTVTRRSQQLAAEMQARHSAALEFESTLRERTRLAADLHDTLEQSLTGLALQLEAGDALLESSLERSRRHFNLGQQLLNRSREDLRRSIWNLRSTALEDRTLDEALHRVAASRSSGTSVKIAVACEGPRRPVSDLVAGNLLLLAEEAITNALKHASAACITITLSFSENSLSLRIYDDGIGFDPNSISGPSSGHFGLQGMRERLKRLAGIVEITSARGKGTGIHAIVPC